MKFHPALFDFVQGECGVQGDVRGERRGIEPDIATGREPRHQNWQAFFADHPAPPPVDASPKVTMAYALQTEIGRAVYGLRECTAEPVIGLLEEVLGFRQVSLGGLAAAAGEWGWVCLALNLKRVHALLST